MIMMLGLVGDRCSSVVTALWRALSARAGEQFATRSGQSGQCVHFLDSENNQFCAHVVHVDGTKRLPDSLDFSQK